MPSAWAGIIVLGALLLVVAAALAVSFVATDESPSYPAPAAQLFLDQCEKAGGDRRTCSCMMAEGQGRYSLDRLIQLGLRARDTGQVPDELQWALAKCSR